MFEKLYSSSGENENTNKLSPQELKEFVMSRNADFIRAEISDFSSRLENSEMYCDLHTHSNYSDGTLSPDELLSLADEKGLAYIALCDHNTVAGLDDFLDAAKNHNVNAIPGIEISTDFKGKPLHLVALFILRSSYKRIEDFTEKYQKSKLESNQRLADNLRRAGFELDYEKLLDSTKNINRAHFAVELVDKGYCANKDAAFDDILSEGKGYYIPGERCDIFAALDFVQTIGAFPILAHPLEKLDADELDELLPSLKERGLMGMETYCTCYGEEKIEQALSLCEKHGLIGSCGSDFHGTAKPDVTLGSVKAPLSVYKRMLRKLIEKYS